ncbi:MAG: PaaI family thioesterase [Bacteroidaceae bacterium]|nr:PaaI family thioesterase [Bacteroidaceae bacterium]
MSLRKIKNPWVGTEGYNCFVCSPNNPIGLHLPFYEDGDYIVTKFKPTHDYESWQNTLHGGIQALLIDETAGWVVCRKLQTNGVTSKMDMQYLKPVSTLLDEITVRAKITKMMRNVAFIEAEILNEDNEVLTRANLVYFCTPQFKLKPGDFPGCELED